jgi:hypothetical protein
LSRSSIFAYGHKRWKIVLRGAFAKIRRNRSVFLGKSTTSNLFFLVFAFWEEGGDVDVAYAAKYFANGVWRFAGLVLVTIVLFSGEDKGWAPLVFAIEIGTTMDGVSEENLQEVWSMGRVELSKGHYQRQGITMWRNSKRY